VVCCMCFCCMDIYCFFVKELPFLLLLLLSLLLFAVVVVTELQTAIL
jgi:hypothetical protein